jgi:hypothetical protein
MLLRPMAVGVRARRFLGRVEELINEICLSLVITANDICDKQV